ncbi:hypothetical protein chiPu_0032005 [Chiloscyllium punctatum]|uniref:Uncharacterized protein n=1 Tax=Chiloscyllium punctatum TaxID=137246 RepID=A0A401TYG3_CHIPU|nr:hypothetical protein [Chiloscyllium punctatum]
MGTTERAMVGPISELQESSTEEGEDHWMSPESSKTEMRILSPKSACILSFAYRDWERRMEAACIGSFARQPEDFGVWGNGSATV